MNRVPISPNGPEVSRLVYGVWRLLEDPEGSSPARIRARIEACLEAGITTFDHADIYGDYGCEQAFGSVLTEAPELREKMEIVTKCGIKLISGKRPDHKIKSYDTSREHIIASVENSLRVLKTDYIDVLLIHRPSPLMNPEEMAQAFFELQSAGKLKHFGVSNFTPSQYDMLATRIPLVTNQLEIHPLRLDPCLDGSIDRCLEHGIRPMAWSPTAGGALFSSNEERPARVRAKLEELGTKYGKSLDQMIYAWLLHHPAGILPVLGTGQIDRIRSATGALDVTLEQEDWFAVWEASAGAEVP